MNYRIRNFIILTVMLISSTLAFTLKPTERIADHRPKIDLETLIPKQFGEWKVDKTITKGIINPEVANQLNEIYSQTLSRTYINNDGQYMMLSIAYGGNQSREFQVHRPETCYASQGFKIDKMVKGTLASPVGPLPVMRLIANQGDRHEPITYWVKIGDTLLRGNLEQGFARLKYGLQGKLPDGLLFRVSSITADTNAAYKIQDNFVKQLISVLPIDKRELLLGNTHG